MLLTDENHYVKTSTWTTSQEGRTTRMLKLLLFCHCQFRHNVLRSFFCTCRICVHLHSEGTTSSASWKPSLHQYTVHRNSLPSRADTHISKSLNVIIWSEAYRVTMPSPGLNWLTFYPIGRSAEEDQVQLWESYFVLSQLMKNLLVSTTDILILTHPAHKRSLW